MTSPAPYRILVTGSRDWPDPFTVGKNVVAWSSVAGLEHRPCVLVHGARPTGADDQARDAVIAHNGHLGFSEEAHPAEWDLCTPRCRPEHRIRKRIGDVLHPGVRLTYCPAAGPRRNAEMVALGADVCLAFILNGSRGATHTADLAEKSGIPTYRFTEPITLAEFEQFGRGTP